MTVGPSLSSGRFLRALSGLSLARAARYLIAPVTAKVNAHFLGVFGVGIMSQISILLGESSSLALQSIADGATKIISLATGNSETDIDAITEDQREQTRREVQEVVGTILHYVTFISFVIVGIMIFAARPLARWLLGDTALAYLLVIAAFSFPLQVMRELVSTVLRGLSAFRTLSISLIVSSIGGLVVVVPLVIFWGLTGAVLALVLSNLTSLILNLLLAWCDPAFRATRPFARPRIRWTVVRELSRYAGSTLIIGTLSPVLALLARAIMVRQIGIEGLGSYAPILVVAGLVLELAAIPLQTVLLPVISRQTDYREIDSILNRTLRLALIGLFCLSGGLLAFRHFIVPLLYNADFGIAAVILGPHLIGVTLYALTWGLQVLYYSLPRLRALVIVFVISNLSLIGFVYFFGQLWGIWGLSLAYFARYALELALNYLYFRREIGLTISAALLRVLAVNLVVLGLLATFPLLLWYQMFLAAVCVALSAWLLLDNQERRVLLAMTNVITWRPFRTGSARSGTR